MSATSSVMPTTSTPKGVAHSWSGLDSSRSRCSSSSYARRAACSSRAGQGRAVGGGRRLADKGGQRGQRWVVTGGARAAGRQWGQAIRQTGTQQTACAGWGAATGHCLKTPCPEWPLLRNTVGDNRPTPPLPGKQRPCCSLACLPARLPACPPPAPAAPSAPRSPEPLAAAAASPPPQPRCHERLQQQARPSKAINTRGGSHGGGGGTGAVLGRLCGAAGAALLPHGSAILAGRALSSCWWPHPAWPARLWT